MLTSLNFLIICLIIMKFTFWKIVIANLRLLLSCQSTLSWTYTTRAGSLAKDILDSDGDKVWKF